MAQTGAIPWKPAATPRHRCDFNTLQRARRKRLVGVGARIELAEILDTRVVPAGNAAGLVIAYGGVSSTGVFYRKPASVARAQSPPMLDIKAVAATLAVMLAVVQHE
jgi:hypothetical protein